MLYNGEKGIYILDDTNKEEKRRMEGEEWGMKIRNEEIELKIMGLILMNNCEKK